MHRFKIMRYGQDIQSETSFFGICFTDTKTGNMAEGDQIVHILEDIEFERAKIIHDSLFGYFVEYE